MLDSERSSGLAGLSEAGRLRCFNPTPSDETLPAVGLLYQDHGLSVSIHTMPTMHG